MAARISRSNKLLLNGGLKREGRLETGRDHYEYMEGGVYYGELQNGQRHGEGVYIWPSGCMYSGTWWQGKTHGLGSVNYLHGGRYIGETRLGRRHGFGAYIFTSNPKEGYLEYVGQWKDNDFHGYGLRVAKNGSYYLGQWKHGQRHGIGINRSGRGFLRTIQDGEWRGDEFMGKDFVEDVNIDDALDGDEDENIDIDPQEFAKLDEAEKIKALAKREEKLERRKKREQKMASAYRAKSIAKIDIEDMFDTATQPTSVLSVVLSGVVDEVIHSLERARALSALAKVRGQRLEAKYVNRAFVLDKTF